MGRRIDKRLTLAHDSRRVIFVDPRVVDLATTRRLDDIDVVVLAQSGPHHTAAVALLDRGIHVVSVGDHVGDVAAMIDEADRADDNDATLIVGAGMSPGLTGLIARHLAGQFDSIDEIHIALHGTAGPACARQHHRALAGEAIAFDDGAFTTARAGTGRELAWFPEPVGAYDCYRAELAFPMVLHRTFPQVSRITARMSANRRDRFTSRLPMLTPPHKEGGVGACRVELRGADASGARLTVIGGIAEMVGTAAAATACAFVETLLRGELRPGLVLPGDATVDTTAVLRDVERFGVRLQEFTGVPNA
ncbi:hypothetical protein [Ilumatobacter sp.]|uniref:hypothetical protein n=1 Tax=Ilumatobacter sp. TaxID=1967498 RepID=UPI003C74E0DC